MHPVSPLPATHADAFSLLRTVIAGAVVVPGDRRYTDLQPSAGERRARPAAIVVAAGIDDVVEALRAARATGLAVAVRSAGQRAAAPPDAALLVDVSALGSVSVDPEAGTVTTGAGATWADVVAHTVPHGLAPVPGEWSTRSAVSDTLAGGMGWLARRHGLACDNVVRYELVTPDGLIVDVTPDAQPELFWALSGAGDGALGVVTAIEFELHPTRPAYAGTLTYPARWAADVIDRWRAWTTNARPELTTALVLDRHTIGIHGCWVGARSSGIALVDSWRAWRAPLGDDWRSRPADDLDAVNPAWLAAGAPATRAMTNDWTSTLRDELVAELLQLVDRAQVGAVEVRLGGAAARTRSGDAANGHARRDQYLLTLADLQVPHDEARAPLAAWVTGAAFLDRTDPEERAARLDDAFGASQRARLAAVKLALDPTGRFRHGLAL